MFGEPLNPAAKMGQRLRHPRDVLFPQGTWGNGNNPFSTGTLRYMRGKGRLWRKTSYPDSLRFRR